MSFGLNRAEVIGRPGADVTVNNLISGGRVANLSIATNESYIDRNSGERVGRTEWHRAVTFQPDLSHVFHGPTHTAHEHLLPTAREHFPDIFRRESLSGGDTLADFGK